jgi:two-component system sensor histidine kinase BaeS
MRRRKVPLRRSLLVRLFVSVVLSVTCAVTATAWLAIATATSAIRAQQGHSLADDGRTYDALGAYAATHTSWDGVQPLLQRLAAQTDRRITLTTPTGTRIAGDGPPAQLPAVASATIDPLRLDALSGDRAGRIDERAVGPFRLSASDLQDLRTREDGVLACLRSNGVSASTGQAPNGRPTIQINDPAWNFDESLCNVETLLKPPDGEARRLRPVERAASQCVLARTGAQPAKSSATPVIDLRSDFSFASGPYPFAVVQNCVDDARRQQLRTYVAPTIRPSLPGSSSAEPTGSRSPARPCWSCWSPWPAPPWSACI